MRDKEIKKNCQRDTERRKRREREKSRDRDGERNRPRERRAVVCKRQPEIRHTSKDRTGADPGSIEREGKMWSQFCAYPSSSLRGWGGSLLSGQPLSPPHNP